MEALFDMFNKIYPMSPELQSYISKHLKIRELKKRELLLQKGQTNSIGSFLNSGLLHCYYPENGNNRKITSWFICPGDLVISPRSFFRQMPTDENIEALEPSELFYLTYNEWKYLNDNFLEFNYIGRELVQKYYMLKDEHAYQLQRGYARECFDWFIKTFPDLISSVPGRHIATFLGVTEETFSRIRSKS